MHHDVEIEDSVLIKRKSIIVKIWRDVTLMTWIVGGYEAYLTQEMTRNELYKF